ncbi:MAG: ribonuclease E/G [Rhodospirillaceae bacterium]
MTNMKMLIDAAHPEETRVAVMDGNQLEEFDVESSARRQLKGNIYLAKVTRVEPSLQAAFVDYGGNRHGFLAFSEIHPDYYQIPVADREQLIAEDEEAHKAEAEDDDAEVEGDEEAPEGEDGAQKAVETVGGDDIDEVETHRRKKPVRRYKIQEVIKRRQILLVQVVKEERGNKGAALTTYLSLAGRYCVLMPNTGKGGGISRKIGSGADRKRLKSVVSDLTIPDGMAVIVRTAGADRGKAEIKRDFEYLIRLWTDIRDLTLESTAPALIHEEANIIKRALRDTYSKDVSEIFVEGDDGYRMAKDLIKVLVPSHAKKVQPYKDDTVPLFTRYRIETQLESMNGQEVQLKSGGYIVINPTEALVAVDVNSGRATRGRNIEETALKTNLEAATEIARQVRLRDLAGLVVIDFIDMDVHRNQTFVERRLKEAMRRDRARIQIGRISPFGLLELSRQRLRPSLTETTSDVCLHCGGSGIRRSTESTALHILRGIEEEGVRGRASEIDVAVPSEAALYILNHKRAALSEIEQKFDIKIVLSEDATLIPPAYNIERVQTKPVAPAEDDADDNAKNASDDGDEEGGRKRRRRRGRRRRDADNADSNTEETVDAESEEDGDKSDDTSADAESDGDEKPSRRRGRRGGRRRNRNVDAASNDDKADGKSDENSEEKTDANDASDDQPEDQKADSADDAGDADEKPKRRRRVRRKKAEAADDNADAGAEKSKGSGGKSDDSSDEVEAKAKSAAPVESPEPETKPEPELEHAAAAADDPNTNVTVVDSGSADSSKRGWWQKPAE